MTFDLDIWHAVHLDPVYIKFSGQGHKSASCAVLGGLQSVHGLR